MLKGNLFSVITLSQNNRGEGQMFDLSTLIIQDNKSTLLFLSNFKLNPTKEGGRNFVGWRGGGLLKRPPRNQ